MYHLSLDRSQPTEIETFVKAHINHITKVEFFLAFHTAYRRSLTVENARSGFRGAGLVPFDPQAFISKLDVKLRTPTLVGPPPADADPWVSQTPRNPTDALSQSTLVKTVWHVIKVARQHRFFTTIKALAKGTELLAHENTLLAAEVRTLRKANEALCKRRRAKKTLVRQGGVRKHVSCDM